MALQKGGPGPRKTGRITLFRVPKKVGLISKKSHHFWGPPSWCYYEKIKQYFALGGPLFDVFLGEPGVAAPFAPY